MAAIKKTLIVSLVLVIDCTTVCCMENVQQDIPLQEIVVHAEVLQSQQHQNILSRSEIASRMIIIPQEYYERGPLFENCGLSGYIVGDNPMKKLVGVFIGSVGVVLVIIFSSWISCADGCSTDNCTSCNSSC
jgi:hypothetical protein